MKLFSIIFVLALGLSGCGGDDGGGSSEPARKEGWTELKLKLNKDACVKDVLEPSPSSSNSCLHLSLDLAVTWTPDNARTVCNCLIDDISYRFTYDDFFDYTCTVVDILIAEGVYDRCFTEAGL